LRDQEIVPGVRSFRIRRANVVAIMEPGAPGITLIDAGLAGSSRPLARALAGHGRSLRDIARVICTHGHPDHAGGAAKLAIAGSEVLIHPADAAVMTTGFRDLVARPSRRRLFAAMTPVPPATTDLGDGDVLDVLGGLTVIHTAGHTPGSVCLWAPRDGLLFVGDVLQRRFGRVVFASSLYSDDVRAARRSVQRLAGLDVRTIVFGHYPPLEEGARAVLDRLVREAATA
jgi:glyoxylase-like metal-dependent hydrolase (beta-lactamase superfamily II)